MPAKVLIRLSCEARLNGDWLIRIDRNQSTKSRGRFGLPEPSPLLKAKLSLCFPVESITATHLSGGPTPSNQRHSMAQCHPLLFLLLDGCHFLTALYDRNKLTCKKNEGPSYELACSLLHAWGRTMNPTLFACWLATMLIHTAHEYFSIVSSLRSTQEQGQNVCRQHTILASFSSPPLKWFSFF